MEVLLRRRSPAPRDDANKKDQLPELPFGGIFSALKIDKKGHLASLAKNGALVHLSRFFVELYTV